MRSVFMTSSGDPYVLLHALSYYPLWKDEIDELWIALNSTMPRETMAELLLQLPPEAHLLYIDRQIGYGKPLELLLQLSPEGNVLLLEDDTIIFQSGVVDTYFTLLERGEYELIGSPRMSCTAATAKQLKTEFDLNYEGRGDKGPMFWPCFLWTTKALLLSTDHNFDPSPWGDTFAWMSVQLRRTTDKILEIPQYHCSPDDELNHDHGWGIFDGKCGYLHLGSLSSGIQSYLLTDEQVPLADLAANIPVLHPQPIPKSQEMINRLAWWMHCYFFASKPLPSIDEHYKKALQRAMRICGVTLLDINPVLGRYLEVINGRTN